MTITLFSNLNTTLFLNINHFTQQTPGLHSLFSFIANDGIVFFALFLLIGYIIAWKRSDLVLVGRAIWAGAGTLLALLLNQPLVHFFHASRPYSDFSHIVVLAHRTSDYGMPSDHATMAGAVTAGLFLINPILGLVSFIASLILAFSRVYIAAHYPSQLFVGLIFGAAVMLISYWALRKPLAWVLDLAMKTKLRILLVSSHSHYDH